MLIGHLIEAVEVKDITYRNILTIMFFLAFTSKIYDIKIGD